MIILMAEVSKFSLRRGQFLMQLEVFFLLTLFYFSLVQGLAEMLFLFLIGLMLARQEWTLSFLSTVIFFVFMENQHVFCGMVGLQAVPQVAEYFPLQIKLYISSNRTDIKILSKIKCEIIFYVPQKCKNAFLSISYIFMNFTDNFKLRTIIEQSITSFKFLDSVKVQDDISSELAGFEISKLLKNQQENQRRFAELVKKRATLTDITQKKELQKIEAQIMNLSVILKESTKKLCKLFKQNPDLEADSLKVSRQRRMLIIKLEELMESIKAGSTSKFMNSITHELESQDQMRRLLEKEKNLNIQIKKLQQQKMAQSKEYQKEIAENQSRIQEFKQTLMQKVQANKIELEYRRKEASAEISNQKRILEQTQKALQKQLQNLRSSVMTEKLVHTELQDYLKSKNDEIKKKTEQLSNKSDLSKQNFDAQINRLNQSIEQTTQQLDLFKKKYQEEEQRKIMREKAERDKLLQKKRRQEQLIRLNNAIKYIQNQYLAWKEAGGGKKKKRR